ncbi:hypothetical protein H5410_050640 [Solanum commersonii]|uniref:Uncharacterized protein n=1 Tax=Solanum commersonii TaxID=4109 RepID=A0A9J5WXM0_SOLCO|nr:hypothetical protein H5410_050640 [Solanum commersonii]
MTRAWRKEKRKGERTREARFIKIVEFSMWISYGVIPTRYVRSHSIGLVHPHTKNVSFSVF